MRRLESSPRILGVVFAAALCAGPAAARDGGAGSGSHQGKTSENADSYVLATGQDSMSTNLSLDELERLRQRLAGDFLWFRRDGKTYLIEDPGLLKKARELFAPLRALDPEREALGRRQEALSEKEQELDREQGEIDRQIDRLGDADGEGGGDTEADADSEFAMSEESAPPTDEERAEIERELDELRGQREALRPREHEIEAKDRELGAVERTLDAREDKLERAAEEKLWNLIDEAVKSGAAKPTPRP